jgi:uncharacterized protein YdhG (YjbR/CyaY superfamily)
MAEKQATKKAPAKKRTAPKASEVFSAEERAAMREAARERKAALSDAEAEREVLEKIAEMGKTDRVMAERIHAIVKDSAPELAPRTWYGMPAYSKDGKVVCYFKPGEKFKARYATLGFTDKANLDDGPMWPAEFAVKELTGDAEARIEALVKKAVS